MGVEADLESSDAEARRRAVAGLVELPSLERVPLVLRALADTDWRVRKEATLAAVAVAPDAALLEALIGCFKTSDDVGLRNAAVEALAAYGEAMLAALARALPELDVDARKLAVEVVGRSGLEAGVPLLARLADDADENVRAAVLDALGELGAVVLGDGVLRVLASRLSAPSALERRAALEGLNRLGAPLSWSEVAPLLEGASYDRAALHAAGRTGSVLAIGPLVEALARRQRSGFEVALEALDALIAANGDTRAPLAERLHGAAPELIDRVRTAARRGEPSVRRAALSVIGTVGDLGAVETSVAALSDDVVAAAAETALLALGSRSVTPLVELAERAARDEGAGDGPWRAAIIELLGRVAQPPVADAVHLAVSRALESNETEVRRAALDALAALGDERALELVGAALEPSEPPGVRRAARAALTAIARRRPEAARRAVSSDPESRPALAIAVVDALGGGLGSTTEDVRFLSEVLSSGGAELRRAAVEALGSVGSALGTEAVVFALGDEELDVRLAAVRALGALRDAAGNAVGVEALSSVLERESDEAVLAAAVTALGETQAPAVVEQLRPLLRDGSPRVAVAAVEAFGRLGEAHRLDVLLDALAHSEPEVVKAALSLIAGERDARAVVHLGAALDHPAWDVRRLAADLLGARGEDLGSELLVARLTAEHEPLVLAAIERALAGQGRQRSAPPQAMGRRTT